MLKWRLAAVAWVGVIFFSSTNLAQEWAEIFWQLLSRQTSATHPQHGLPYLILDKGFHVSLFFVLAVLLCLALPVSPRRNLVVVVTGAVVGSCSEALQSFFPGRDPAMHDVLINIGGTMLGLLAVDRFFSQRVRFTLKQ